MWWKASEELLNGPWLVFIKLLLLINSELRLLNSFSKQKHQPFFCSRFLLWRRIWCFPLSNVIINRISLLYFWHLIDQWIIKVVSWSPKTESVDSTVVCCLLFFIVPELTWVNAGNAGITSSLTASRASLPLQTWLQYDQSYLIDSSSLLAVRASCGPLSVRAAGRRCQFCRDALGASLSPRAS